MTTSLLIAILTFFATAHPDVRIEWKGKFVEPQAIIQELKSMENEENKVEGATAPASEESTENVAPAENTEDTTPADEQSEGEKGLENGARNA